MVQSCPGRVRLCTALKGTLSILVLVTSEQRCFHFEPCSRRYTRRGRCCPTSSSQQRKVEALNQESGLQGVVSRQHGDVQAPPSSAHPQTVSKEAAGPWLVQEDLTDQIPNEADRRYVKEWAREEFKRNKDATDEAVIRMMVTQGTMQLQELERSLQLAKS